LFPAASAVAVPRETGTGTTVVDLPIEQIRPNPQQPRRRFDEESLTALAQSIRAHGLLAPIMVRTAENASDMYEIITGERRWRAARLAGLTTIAAIIRAAHSGEAIELAILENVQRADLNPIEEAAGYRQLLDEHRYTQEMLAQRIGKSRPAVANALRLLALPDAVQALVRDGKLSAGHARALASLPAGRARELADEAVRRGYSVREVEQRATQRGAGAGRDTRAATAAAPILTPELADAETRLRFALATRVSIRPRPNGGGAVEIQYADENELTRILERIAGVER
jgi:ParB family chromosome partitioning protein